MVLALPRKTLGAIFGGFDDDVCDFCSVKRGGGWEELLIERFGKKQMWLVRFSMDLFHTIFNYKYGETHCLLVTLQKYSRYFI